MTEADHEYLRYLQARHSRLDTDETFADLCRFVRYLERKGA